MQQKYKEDNMIINNICNKQINKYKKILKIQNYMKIAQI